MRYSNPKEFIYFSKRYNKYITVPQGFWSDGATGARDIYTKAWWLHDIALIRGEFDDGSKCDWLKASYILYDVLAEERRWFRKYTWFIATVLYQSIKHI